MHQLAVALTSVRSPDADKRRRGRLLIIITLGMAALALAFIPVILVSTHSVFAMTTLAAAAAIFGGVALLARAGRVTAGAYILIGITVFAIAASIAGESRSSNTPLYMVLAVLFAGVLLPPGHVWGVLALGLAGIAAGAGLLPPALRDEPGWRQALLGAPLLLVMVSLITFLSSRATVDALDSAQRARAEAEEASTALAASNTALEAKVEERTTALRQIADEQRAIAGQLKASLDAQHELNRVIAELSVPIIPISDGTLVVPLVGNIDSARAVQLLAAVLDQVEASGARTVVLDVTGVAVVDTQVAAALLRVADAARLMGAAAMLVGIRPEVAQALVHLGVDLSALRTAATLADGLVTIGATSGGSL
jgi:anti-anti-sigma regulatory factor